MKNLLTNPDILTEAFAMTFESTCPFADFAAIDGEFVVYYAHEKTIERQDRDGEPDVSVKKEQKRELLKSQMITALKKTMPLADRILISAAEKLGQLDEPLREIEESIKKHVESCGGSIILTKNGNLYNPKTKQKIIINFSDDAETS